MNIVVVDDEIFVRVGIRTTIEELGGGHHVVGTFANAQAALKFCLSAKPDLVFTDIVMPGMSGIEFIRELNALNSGVRVVVLSCHDEYQYVRQAYSLGVEDYILKYSCEPAELERVISKVASSLSKAGGARAQAEPAAEPDGPPSELPGAGKWLVASALVGQINGLDAQASEKMVSLLLNELLSRAGIGRASKREGGEWLITFQAADPAFPLVERARAALSEVCFGFQSVYNLRVVFGLSAPARGRAAFEAACQAARAARALWFYVQESVIDRRAADLPVERMNAFLNQVRESSSLGLAPLQAAPVFAGFMEECAKKLVSPAQLKSALFRALALLKSLAEASLFLSISSEDFHHLPSLDRLEALATLPELTAWIGATLAQLDARLGHVKASDPLLVGIKRYFDAHFAEDIRLADVARAFNMSQSHFCHVFKRETGMNFVVYLNQARVTHAMELLASTDLSTEQIAAQVGYNNANYFVRMFKKVTGQGVGDFRRQKRGPAGSGF